jgi:hypothetical protein
MVHGVTGGYVTGGMVRGVTDGMARGVTGGYGAWCHGQVWCVVSRAGMVRGSRIPATVHSRLQENSAQCRTPLVSLLVPLLESLLVPPLVPPLVSLLVYLLVPLRYRDPQQQPHHAWHDNCALCQFVTESASIRSARMWFGSWFRDKYEPCQTYVSPLHVTAK